ncbi:MAG TPA: hypothetical protein VKL19_02695, partial [Thermoanaerobaculia bacterium]|nr:hypothetical protein [Thermoanaerobaculia bacterium]
IVMGQNVPTAPQRYVLIANAPLGTTAVTCTDVNESNDTAATATPIASATPILGRFCAQGDVDYFKFTAISPGSASVTLTATDTPVRMTVLINGVAGPVQTIAAGTTGAIVVDFPPIVSAPGTMAMAVRVEPAGAIGSNASYTITATYSFSSPARKRTVRH